MSAFVQEPFESTRSPVLRHWHETFEEALKDFPNVYQRLPCHRLR